MSEKWKFYPAKEVMWKTRVRINLWAASHEEKWWHVRKQIKEKIAENQKTVKIGSTDTNDNGWRRS